MANILAATSMFQLGGCFPQPPNFKESLKMELNPNPSTEQKPPMF